ncbi:MAG TPA: c-type cytochrome [Casimicrobiaceae bacterium]
MTSMKSSGSLEAVASIALVLWSAGVLAQRAPSSADDERVRRGEYLAIAGDCVACHTAPGGKPLAGGPALPTPIGEIIATNITPSKTHGIGNYTLAQFSAALRLGVRADGAHLYPAMPYTAYAKVTDDDASALYAYFMRKVAPVDATPASTSLPFPFNIRASMAAWNLLFLDSKPFVPDPKKSEEWNRGAYLARGLAHCGTCHTPRNLMMAEVPSRGYGGGEVGPWHAPNITSDATSGIGGWSNDELIAYLRDGRAANKAQAAGPMAEAVDDSLRHLTEGDLRAIVAYLKSVPAIRDPGDTRPPYAWGDAADDLARIRGVVLPDDPNRMTGPQLYDAWCASCHQARGQGSFDGGLPPLFHNTALGSATTNNLVAVMLDGIVRQAESEEVVMPGFARELTDAQIATLAGYLVRHYGNPGAVVTAEQVSALRAEAASTSHLVLAARLLAIGVLVAIAALIFAFARHRRFRARLT